MPSASGRCCSASRWRTRARPPRPISWLSTGGCSRSPGPWRRAIASGAAEGSRTRFAPAPTGFLHLGHVANALWVWGIARSAGATILLRIEDHDRQRSRPEYDAALLEDLEWLGFVADEGPVRQTTPDAVEAYAAALEQLRADGRVYACTCTRATLHGWSGPGCPGGCRRRALPEDAGTSLRVALDGGTEAFEDLRLGSQTGHVSPAGDLVARDRAGNWTYGFAGVVDDLRHGIDIVIRGEDLLPETARQIRLGRLLGRQEPARFLHHPLIRKANGAKLSKSDGDTGVRELRAAGWSAQRVRDDAAARGGVPDLGVG